MAEVGTPSRSNPASISVRTRRGDSFDITLEGVLASAREVAAEQATRMWVNVGGQRLPAVDVVARATGANQPVNLLTWVEVERVLTGLGLHVERGSTGVWAPPKATPPGFASDFRNRPSPESAWHPAPRRVGYGVPDMRVNQGPPYERDGDAASDVTDGADNFEYPAPLTDDEAESLSEHVGRWVALRDGHVVAVADSVADAKDTARRDDDSQVLIVYVPLPEAPNAAASDTPQ